MIVNQAYVTLATNDEYALAAQVLGYSLRATATQRTLVVLTGDGVSLLMRERLQMVFDHVIILDRELNSHDEEHLSLMNRPELGCTYSKLYVWLLSQFSRVVFLDADCLVLRNIDELFELESDFSAAPDIGWPDCFNSGVFVCTPSDNTFHALVHLAATQGSFDGGDQGLLNTYFSDWSLKQTRRLPFIYNATPGATYSYIPAYRRFHDTIKVVHFLGIDNKPWRWPRPEFDRSTPSPLQELVHLWWEVYLAHVESPLLLNTTSSASFFPGTSYSLPSSPSQEPTKSATAMPFQKYRIQWQDKTLHSSQQRSATPSGTVSQMVTPSPPVPTSILMKSEHKARDEKKKSEERKKVTLPYEEPSTQSPGESSRATTPTKKKPLDFLFKWFRRGKDKSRE